MKLPPLEYHVPGCLDEALALLAHHGDEAKVLAGGQSLVPLLALRLSRPEHLVDINRLQDLASIDDGDGLRLGALTRHRVLERSPEIAAANPLLAACARLIGHAAIRNRGTLGGSLAHADSSAELPAVLLALDGEIEAVCARGSRRIAAADLFQGFLTTSLEPDELLQAVRFPAWLGGTGWSFQEFSRRSGDFGVAGVAATLRLDGRGTIAGARIALTGVGATPIRARKAEAALVGHLPSEQAWAAAAADATSGLEPRSDVHGSSAYRRHLAAVLTKRALQEAQGRAHATA